jgi:hypothetical protein
MTRRPAAAASVLSLASLASCSTNVGPIAPMDAAVATDAAVDAADSAQLDGAGESAADVEASVPLNPSNYDGCNIFPADDGVYNTDVVNAAIDPNSAPMIASQTNVDQSSFAAETYFGTEKVNLDEGNSAPKYQVTGNPAAYPSGPTNAARWPWEASWFIEPGGAGADHHAFVLDSYGKPDHCYIYEAWQMTFTPPSGPLGWSDGNYWDLGQAFQTPRQQGYAHNNGADALGTPIFAGAVLLDQVAAGNVMHALNVAVQAHSLSAGPGVYPSSSTGGGWSYTGTLTAHEMPLGAHVRLRSAFDDSTCSVQARHITYALQHYGGYVADTGFGGNGLYLFDSNSGANAWDETGIKLCLSKIHFTDFDVLVPPSPATTVPVNPNP